MTDSVFISNIQRFSTKDGPGIRTTVFFKGCPLKCIWCHNPETQSAKPEMMYNGENCTLCGRCVFACPSKALSVSDGKIVTDIKKCTVCEKCADVCYYNAREISGKAYSSSEICKVLLRDSAFYSESGGGVTFSGGEAMMYPDFLLTLLKFCKENHISTAIDTSGFAPFSDFEKVMEYTDIFLYDIKASSSALHKKLTGVPNELIWNNLFSLSEKGACIFLRLPLIEGCNADFDEVGEIAERVVGLKIAQINLLPYHDMGKYKYTKLGRGYDSDSMSTPSKEKLEQFKKMFEAKGFTNVKIGG
jgi:pyruvate formate lyase activating enzyme